MSRSTMKHCCFCPLDVGLVLLGWIKILISTIIAIICITLLTHGRNLRNYHKPTLSNYTLDSVETMTNYGIGLATSIITIILSILLVIGTLKRNRSYLIPYLFVDAIKIMLLAIYTLTSFFSNFSWVMCLISLIIGLILAQCTYFWFCVLSFYNLLKKEEIRMVIVAPSIAVATSSNENYPDAEEEQLTINNNNIKIMQSV